MWLSSVSLVIVFLDLFTSGDWATARTLELVSFPAGSEEALRAVNGENEQGLPGWWFQAGSHVYQTPSVSSGLSQAISDYFYARSDRSAFTAAMRKNYVGGQDVWHVFHLPNGKEGLELPRGGTRWSSFSALTQLENGTVLSTDMPRYQPRPEYVHPLDEKGQALERVMVSKITPPVVMEHLKRIMAFPTRSYQNADASKQIVSLLKQSFDSMGLKTCLHNVASSPESLINVVAYIPGNVPGNIVVGAHYDTRPFQGAAPGANDNGSGLAALLAIANATILSKITPRKGIYFVAFGGEEAGLLGSAGFVRALTAYELKPDEGIPLECRYTSTSSFLQVHKTNLWKDANRALVLDEVGWMSPRYNKRVVNVESYDWNSDMLDNLKHSSDTHNGEELEIVHSSHPFGSDHMSFLDQGVRAVLSMNADDEAYPQTHGTSDDIQNIDPELLSMVSKMNAGALLRMAGVAS